MGITQFAHSHGRLVIAEGLETEAEAKTLQSLQIFPTPTHAHQNEFLLRLFFGSAYRLAPGSIAPVIGSSAMSGSAIDVPQASFADEFLAKLIKRYGVGRFLARVSLTNMSSLVGRTVNAVVAERMAADS